MDPTTQTLIAFLQKESRSLRRLIAEAVREEEYNSAAAHKKALYRTLAKINVLQNLEDKNHHRKEFLRFLLRPYPDKERIEYLDAPKEAELARLEEQGPVPVPVSRILHTQLGSVIAGDTKGMNIVLNATAGLVISVRHQKYFIRIYFANISHLLKTDALADRQIIRLCSIGFARLSEERLQMNFGKNEGTHARIMAVLSRIVFDVFNYSEFAGKSYIEVVQK